MSLFLPTVRRRVLSRWFNQNKAAKSITLLLFTLVLLFIMAGIYEAISEGFQFINRDTTLGAVASLYAYELFLLVISLLTVGSSVITSLFVLFRKPEDGLVLATPSYPSLFWTRIRDVALSSSWPLVIFLVPALAAIQHSFNLSTGILVVALLGFSLYSLFLTIATSCLLLLVASALGHFLRFSLLTSLMGALCLAAVLAVGIWSHSGNLFSTDNLALQDTGNVAVQQIDNRFHLLPSGIAADLLFHTQQNQPIPATTDLLTIVVITGIFTLLLIMLSGHYLRLWQQLQQGSSLAHTSSTSSGHSHTLSSLLRSSHTPLGALVAKEMVLLVRDRQQLSWLLFLSGMWAIQAILVSGITGHSQAGGSPTTIQLIEFLITLYFTSTAVLRFVYPSFSTERRSAWLLACAPIDLRQILIAKALWFSIIFVLISECISLVSLRLAGSQLTSTTIFLGALVIAVLTVVAFGIASSVFFPNFETDDPQVLSTSLPGLGLVALCLFYGVFSTLVLQQALEGSLKQLAVWGIASLLMTGILYVLSLVRVRKLEFIRVTH